MKGLSSATVDHVRQPVAIGIQGIEDIGPIPRPEGNAQRWTDAAVDEDDRRLQEDRLDREGRARGGVIEQERLITGQLAGGDVAALGTRRHVWRQIEAPETPV